MVVEPGLVPGQRVVVDGQLRLTPGAKVQLKDAPSTAPATQESPLL
jgi:multidrug efflux system membrane fusion protein